MSEVKQSRRVLILTYYWPPSGGSGVQRWLKFVKYLKRKGWDPVVYTVENGEYPVLDPSLEKEVPAGVTVIRKRIWEPYRAYKLLTGGKKQEGITIATVQEQAKASLGGRLSRYIRANWMIPDPRVFWVRPSVRFLRNWLRENPVDCIITSGPPHSLHLIGLQLKRQTGLPWIADFRDPWRTNYFLLQLGMSKGTWKKQIALERQVVEAADRVVVVTRTMKSELEAWMRQEPLQKQTPVELITNGYDTEDFAMERPVDPDAKFSIVFTGTFVNSQNPEILWRQLQQLLQQEPGLGADLEIRLVGEIGDVVRRSLTEHGLLGHTVFQPYLPHPEIVRVQRGARVLLLSVNNTPTAKLILTGKLFEYLASGRPILCFCPEGGDAGVIVEECGAGYVFHYGEEEKLGAALRELYRQFREGRLPGRTGGFEQYSREKLTERLMGVVESTLSSSIK